MPIFAIINIVSDFGFEEGEIIMPELESLIEQKLIEQLIYGDSQWTYRPDLKTEADFMEQF